MQPIYDLETRTTAFSTLLIQFCKQVPRNVITTPLISQLIRSGTSIGANYHEANGACSKADFRNKISLCKKEAKETLYWIGLISEAGPETTHLSEGVAQEAQELVYIFAKISSSLKQEVLKN